MTNRELLETIVIKLDNIDQRLDKVEQRLDSLEQRVTNLECQFADMEHQISNLECEFADMKHRISNLECEFADMKHRITNIELTLENEVSRNICTIAEAHLDLSRKFDQALKVKEDDELVRVRLNVLENDVRKIKQRLEIA